MIQIDKQYTDLVAADGQVAICYAVQLRVAGLSWQRAAIEHFESNGRHHIESVPKPTWSSHGLEAGLATMHPGQAIDWTVDQPRAQVSVQAGGARLSGLGYRELLSLRGRPRGFGIREIHWGRIHEGAQTLVFNSVKERNGRCWQILVQDGRVDQACRYSLDYDGQALRLGCEAKTCVLQHERVLHDGPIIDAKRFPKAIGRAAAQWYMGQGHETRWLSRSSSDGWAIHERVLFN